VVLEAAIMTSVSAAASELPAPERVWLEVDYRKQRNRLTTLVQPLAAFPQLFIADLMLLVGAPLVVFAWFALLITGRWPSSAFQLVCGFSRFVIRIFAYAHLLVDRYPQLITAEDPEYPVRLLIGAPKAHYSRLKTALRWPYLLPAYFVAVGGMIALTLGLIASWVVILFVGRQPEALFRLERTGLRWQLHYWLIASLVLEDYDWSLDG
jgi:hypothetical protein